jgi:predicted MFS family arabinose efflux permease
MTMGVIGTFFPPAMAGMTLGIVGRRGLDLRIGRNETFNHAGNVVSALCAGALGYWLSRRSIFYFTAVMCAVTIFAVFFVRRDEIDFARSRGCEEGEGKPANVGMLESLLGVLKNRALFIFIASVVLFHFANAAMLPLIGQKLARHDAARSSLYLAVSIIGAQVVMIPVAMAAGRFAPTWGTEGGFSFRLRGAADPRPALHAERQPLFPRQRATDGRHRRGDLRGGKRAHDRRSYARHGPV